MRLLPASIAFSTSSLTTEAGRSTTSPAAIWSAKISLNSWIFAIYPHLIFVASFATYTIDS